MDNIKCSCDIIEVFVKKKFGIKLNDADQQLYQSLDDDIIDLLDALMNSTSFLYDIEKIVNGITISENFTLSDKERIKAEIKKEKVKLLTKKN